MLLQSMSYSCAKSKLINETRIVSSSALCALSMPLVECASCWSRLHDSMHSELSGVSKHTRKTEMIQTT